jgi:hypothetical protein
MKAAFGLAGILVTLGVIVWFMGAKGGALDEVKEAHTVQQKADQLIKPLANENPDGGRISDTMTLEPQFPNGGRFAGLLVTRIEPNNVLYQRYGLRQYDLINKINGMPARDIDPGMAEAQVQEAAGRQWELTVLRGTQELTLPKQAGTAAPGATGQPGTPQPAPPPGGATNSLQRQLEGIQKIPTH